MVINGVASWEFVEYWWTVKEGLSRLVNALTADYKVTNQVDYKYNLRVNIE